MTTIPIKIAKTNKRNCSQDCSEVLQNVVRYDQVLWRNQGRSGGLGGIDNSILLRSGAITQENSEFPFYKL